MEGSVETTATIGYLTKPDPDALANTAFKHTQIGERVELNVTRRLPGATTGVWVGKDVPGRRMTGPSQPQCDLGAGFGATWRTKRLVASGTLMSHTADRFDGDGIEDSSKVAGWRSSAAVQPIAARDGEKELEQMVRERHSGRIVRVDQSRDVEYYKQFPPY